MSDREMEEWPKCERCGKPAEHTTDSGMELCDDDNCWTEPAPVSPEEPPTSKLSAHCNRCGKSTPFDDVHTCSPKAPACPYGSCDGSGWVDVGNDANAPCVCRASRAARERLRLDPPVAAPSLVGGATDEDFKRLFGEGWREAKAQVAKIEAMPFPEGFDATDILEPADNSAPTTSEKPAVPETSSGEIPDFEKLLRKVEDAELYVLAASDVPRQQEFLRDVRAVRDYVTSLRTERDEARTKLAEFEEMEAACCPEDVGFVEYIRALEADRRMLAVWKAKYEPEAK